MTCISSAERERKQKLIRADVPPVYFTSKERDMRVQNNSKRSVLVATVAAVAAILGGASARAATITAKMPMRFTEVRPSPHPARCR